MPDTLPNAMPNALLIARRAFLAATVWGASWAQAAPLVVAPVQTQAGGARYAAEAVVEAVRESQMAAQVMGRITDVLVHAGERVQAGQVLLRIDPSVAGEQVAASRAQVAQAEAMLAAARTDYTRAQRLHDKQYLSDAALEKARAQFLAAQAQAQALTAQAQASGAQAAFYTLRAPYAGWVSRVDVSQGDQAAPGRALLTVYDPTALRVSASVPESVVRQIDHKAAPAIALPDGPAVTPSGPLEVLPGLDPVSHSATVRVAVKATEPEAMPVPGQFARLSLVLQPAADRAADGVARATLWVPRAAVVQRGELSAVYVVDAAGKASLRQVRLGEPQGDQIEVLAGVQRGENVALDPVAAARQGQPGAR